MYFRFDYFVLLYQKREMIAIDRNVFVCNLGRLGTTRGDLGLDKAGLICNNPCSIDYNGKKYG